VPPASSGIIEGGSGATWHDLLPNARGCRAYADLPFTDPMDCPNQFPGWDIKDEAGNHVAVKPVASIRPNPKVLMDTLHPDQQTMENQIKNMILDGAQRAGGVQATGGPFSGPPRLTVWHEAGNLYKSGGDKHKPSVPWSDYGVVPGQTTTMQYDGTTW